MATVDQTDIRALAGHFEATVITLAVALVVWRLTVALIDRFFARRFVSRFVPRVATFCTLAKSMAGLLVVVIGGLVLLNVWSVNITPAVWSAGFITAALAFGSQTVVRDIVTGFFFLFEDQYDVGDRVELITAGGQTLAGTVESMGLRTTKVVDRQGRFAIVPNGNIALVTNASRLPSIAGFTIGLPWKDDALAMRDRLASHAREIAAAAGKHDAHFTVSLIDSTTDVATYRIELRSANAETDLAQLDVREQLVARLQRDGWLPGREDSH